jgi:hypothetical protein
MSKHRLLATAAFIVTAGLILNTPVWAQQTTEGNGIPVHTVVTVEPQKGSEVPVINPEDVMVFEGKDRDKVVDWIPAQGDHGALELYVLLDDGSNMTLGTQLDSIKKFLTEQAPTTKVGVAYMQNGIARIAQDLTTDHAQAANKVRLPMGIRGANASPYFSVSDLVKKWPATKARREVIMASDGIDPYYLQPDLLDPYLDAAISDAQRAGIIISAIYTPGVGHFGHSYWMTYWGQLYIAELAEKTGGEGYYIGMTGPPVSFSPYLDEAMERLGHQYLLTFLAKPPKKAGLQAVKIKTEVPHVDLVAPRQIYVPAGK